VLVWLSVWSKVQVVCIWSSRCHCRRTTPSSLDSFKSRLVLPFWYRFTQIVLENRSLNGCNSNSSSSFCKGYCSHDNLKQLFQIIKLKWSQNTFIIKLHITTTTQWKTVTINWVEICAICNKFLKTNKIVVININMKQAWKILWRFKLGSCLLTYATDWCCLSKLHLNKHITHLLIANTLARG